MIMTLMGKFLRNLQKTSSQSLVLPVSATGGGYPSYFHSVRSFFHHRPPISTFIPPLNSLQFFVHHLQSSAVARFEQIHAERVLKHAPVRSRRHYILKRLQAIRVGVPALGVASYSSSGSTTCRSAQRSLPLRRFFTERSHADAVSAAL